MRIFLPLISLFLISSNAFSQEYLELMQRENVNFYEVQRSAEKYFANRDKGRGSGYKHYKRWEYISQKEIDDQGFIIKPKQVWNELDIFLRDYYSTHSQLKKGSNKSLTGDWSSLGPYDWQRTSGWNPGVGRIVCIDVDDNNQNLIYVGSPTGGLWKTTDGGANWQVLTDSFPVMDIWSVEIDPTNSNIVYMGTAGGGILKTTDGGNTWNQTGSIGGTIRDILIHPTNNNIVFAARPSGGGVYRSTNGGASWTRESTVNAEDLRFKPGNPNIVYACGNDFQRSTDGGITWTTITSGITASERMKMDVSPANPNYVYLVQKSGSRFGRVYRSTDSGVNFTIREQYNGSNNNYLGYNSDGTDNGGQAGRDMAIAVSNTNAEEIIIAGIILFRSTDGGDNYSPLTEWFLPNSLGYVHADVEVLDFVGNTLFVGSDGGIYNSSNNGSSFTDLTAGLGIRQFYRIGCSQSDPNVVSGGSQDNGTSVMRGTSQNWVDWLGADGMETFVDYNNANNLFGTSQYGSMYKSTNQGNSRINISKPSGVGNGEWVTPFEIDPILPTTIYVGFDRLYKNTSGSGPASNWSAISPNLGSGNMDEICLAPTDANTIYVSYSSQLYRTTDGGNNWTNITEPWTGFINYISVDPNNPLRVAVAVSGSNSVYISNDGGNNWTNLTLNLPNIGTNCILLDATAENGIYVGMQSGVYYKDDNLATWIPFLTDLPRVRVLELEIVNSVGKIRAATYGRGLWESDVYSGNGGSLAPVANFSANITNAVVNTPIAFLDNSIGTPTTWNWSFPGGTPSASTNQNPIVTYAAAGTYDVSLSVSNANGSDAITKTNFITITNYCVPDPTNGTSDGDYIDGVALGTINNQNTGSATGPSFTDYTNLSTDIPRNSNQTLNIISGSYFNDYYAAWIDYNQDNDFDDPGEKLGEFESTTPFQSLNIPFTVPLAAQLGATTMRVRCVYNGLNMNPCTDYTWGETEDYSVVITSAVACSPTFTVGTGDGDFIDGVVFGSLSNIGTGSLTGPDYTDYGNLSCQVSKADSHYLKITGGSYSPDYFAAWIDWNQNGEYTDPGEKIGEFITSTAFETDSFLVPVPLSTDTGFYQMRIRCSYNSPNMSPCAQYTWGETEDYLVEIIPSSDLCQMPNPPIAINDSVCESGSMTLAVSGSANFMNWYTDLLNDTMIHTGSSFTTPVLTATKSYYVSASNEVTGKNKTTWFNSNNGASGNLFDLYSAKNIRLDGFSVNLSGTTPKEVAVYYKQGTFEGFETNSSAWTLLGVDTVIPAGVDLPTFVDIGGLEVDQEETYGILVHSNQMGFNYTTLSADTSVYNEDISLRLGKGMGSLFSQVFSPRGFNGTVHYTKYSGCESSRIQVTAKVNPLPQVQISNAGPLCVSDNSISLNANPGGGVFSGAASPIGNFDPQAAGVGFHDIYYNYTDLSGCSNSDTITIEVKALPNVTLNSFSSICENDPAMQLSGGNPSGGIFSGTAVNNGEFDPSVSGVGTFNITYSYTDNFGCSNSAIQSITVNPKPTVSLSENTEFCDGDAAINLNGGLPGGGMYFGTGVTGNQFDPNVAGIGNHLLTYTYQNSNGCSDTASLTLNVNALPNISHTSISDVCEDASSFTLSGASPSGGVYSGSGVSSNNFDPQISGVGTFNLLYTYTDNNSCSDNILVPITVNPLPVVNLSGIPDLCENDNPISLTGGSPLGGAYSGPGVLNGVLDPSVNGAGQVVISYNYTDPLGCSNSSTQSVNISSIPNVTFNANTEFCEGDAAVSLSGGSPSGGQYFGTAVNANQFNPVSAGIGSHLVNYTYQNSNGCSDTASLTFNVNANPNVSHSSIADVCEDAFSFTLTGASPSGGMYSGTGISGNNFDPQVSGVGAFNITYSFTDNNGCSDNIQFSINVNALPSVNLSGIPDLCESDNPIILTGGTPSGGVYSGAGISNGILNPSIAGTGSTLITYSYTDASGCTNTANQSININAKPIVAFSTNTEFCDGDAAVSLSGGSPSGGMYFGNGVNANQFNPVSAGVGNHLVNYTYQNSNGCSDTASLTFNVNPKPAVSHNNIPDVCADASVFTLSGGIPSGGNYSGNWVSSNSFDPQQSGVGIHPIYYSFTNGNGCTDSTLVTIQVNSLPTVVLQNIPDICENESPVNLAGGSPVGGIYSGIGVTAGQFDPSVSGTGTFTITYNYSDVNGCSNSDSKSINVLSAPQATLSLIPSICENEGAINLTGGNPAGGVYFGSGVIGSSFDPTITGPGIQSVSYVVSNANSCSDTATANIQVNAAPIVTHSVVQDFCIDEPITTLNGGNPSGGSYSGLGISGNQFDPQLAGLGSHTVFYTFTNSNGCTDSVAVNITVLDKPVVTMTSIPDICEDSPVQALVGSPSGGIFSGTGVNGTGFFTSLSGPGTFVITYTFTNSAGCTGLTTDTVTVFANPVVTLDTFTAICENEPMITLSGGLPAGGLYSGTGVSNGNFDPLIAGVGVHQITYTFTDANSCASQAFEDIEVKLSPQAEFGYSISGLTTDFSDSSINANDWSWNFDDGNTSTIQNPTHTYASNGNYNVCLTVNNNGCSDEYCELLTIITSLSTSIYNDQFQFYPNPFESKLNYTMQIEKGGLYRIDLMDIRSVNLKSFELNLESGENTGQLDLNGLPAGTYILKVSNADSQKTIKLEKVK